MYKRGEPQQGKSQKYDYLFLFTNLYAPFSIKEAGNGGVDNFERLKKVVGGNEWSLRWSLEFE